MIKRSFDAERLNDIVNHPAVRPWVCGVYPDYIDLTEIVANRDNYLLETESGMFLMLKKESGTYEIHTQFLPEGAGAALPAAREGLNYMFTKTPCERLTTSIPVGNKHAKLLALRMGFTYQGNHGEWLLFGNMVPLELYTLNKENR